MCIRDRADREQIYERLKAMNPSILDILPLSLDEVFSYELDALGYNCLLYTSRCV